MGAALAGSVLALSLPGSADAGYQFDFAFGSSGTGSGQFQSGSGIALLPSNGNVYVTDDFVHRLQRFTSGGTHIDGWGWGVSGGASYQICTTSCQAGLAGSEPARFSGPEGIAIQPSPTPGNGVVYVADAGNNRIQYFNTTGAPVNRWGSAGTAEGQFSAPSGVATDPGGNVYVTDTGNNRVQVFDSTGNFVRMWGWGVDDGTAVLQVCTSGCQAGINGAGLGQFSQPDGIALNPAGNRVYVSDINHRIQEFTPTGTYSNGFGGSGTGDGQFAFPGGMAVDTDGNLYVADINNHRIQKLNPGGSFIATWGWGVDDGSNSFQTCFSGCQAGILGPGQGQLEFVPDLDVDPAGDVYAVDRNNERVQVFAAVPPETSLDATPGDFTSDNTPTFGLRSGSPESTFRCRIDADPFSTCNAANVTAGGETTGEFTSAALNDGPHTFDVQAIDRAAIRDDSSAQTSFTIDSQPPSIDALDVEVNRRKATATSSASDPPPGTGLTRECKLDSKPYKPCDETRVYKRLKPGKHKVRVRVTDQALNQDVAKQGFKVKR